MKKHTPQLPQRMFLEADQAIAFPNRGVYIFVNLLYRMSEYYEFYEEPRAVVAAAPPPPVSFHSPPAPPGPRRCDSFAAAPLLPDEKNSDFFDSYISAARVHPVDSDDDCSMMSGLSSFDGGDIGNCHANEESPPPFDASLLLFRDEHSKDQDYAKSREFYESSGENLAYLSDQEKDDQVVVVGDRNEYIFRDLQDSKLPATLHNQVIKTPTRHFVRQDSKPSATKAHNSHESATVVSTSFSSHITLDEFDSRDDDTDMSTTALMLDGVSGWCSIKEPPLSSSPTTTTSRDSTCYFEALPDELICFLSNYLNVESLSQARLVNKRLLSIASEDGAGWKRHCQSLWSQKAHVSKDAFALLENGNARKAFYHAGREAVSRQHVTPEELCFDTATKQGIIWSFRFKATAGTVWTSWDPWWTGAGKAREMVFLLDGRVMQYIRSTNNGESDYLVRPFQDTDNGTTGMDIRWRLISQPMDLPKRPNGSYLRLTIGGRDVPTYVVHRSPTGNWGFVMESCWGVHASFPLKPRKQTVETPTERPARIRLRRTSNGEARWMNVADMESEDDEEEENVATTEAASTETKSNDNLEDSDLSVTTAWQWREAILHNQGFRMLPEGENAASQFGEDYWNNAIEQLTGEQRNELGI